jgi:hypothetical protein
MPIAPIIIASLIGAAATATTTGLQASGVFGPNEDAIKRDQAKQIEASNLKSKQDQELSQQQALRRAAPDIQSQVGGNLTPASFSAQTAAATGDPGAVALAQKTLFQGGGEGAPASDPGLTGLRPNAGGGGGSGLTPAFEAFGGNPSSGGRDLSGSDKGFDISKLLEMFGGGGGGGSQPEFQMHDMLTA